jgi:hypothetical protein
MNRQALFEFVSCPFVVSHLLLGGRTPFFTTLEVLRPARALSDRSVAPRLNQYLAIDAAHVDPDTVRPDLSSGPVTRKDLVRLVVEV